MLPFLGQLLSPRRMVTNLLVLTSSLLLGVNAPAQEPAPPTEEAIEVETEEASILEESSVEIQDVTSTQDVVSEDGPKANVLDRAGIRLDGRLDLRLRFRSQDGNSDSDTDGFASLFMDGRTTNEAGKENLRFRIDAYASMDFNGLESPTDSFYGLADTRNSRLRPFLYSAWLESNEIVSGAKIRLGRQEVHREDALYFDGARADFGDGAWRAVAYFGKPVRFYESNRSGDLLGGLGLRWWARRDLRFGIDQIFLRDEAPLTDPTVRVNDQLTIIDGRWIYSPNATFTGSSSWISGRPRRTQMRALMQEPTQRLWSRLELRHQNDYGDVVATDISPFAATLGNVQPYWSANAEIGKGISTDLDFSLGYQGRWLDNVDNEGLYNRQYQRWYSTLTHRNLFDSDWQAGLRADFWNSSGPSVVAGGVFTSTEPNPGEKYEVGTDYSKYRYDAFTGREYLDDRQVYARLRYPLREDLSMRIRLARDGSQLGVDYRVEVSLGWEF